MEKRILRTTKAATHAHDARTRRTQAMAVASTGEKRELDKSSLGEGETASKVARLDAAEGSAVRLELGVEEVERPNGVAPLVHTILALVSSLRWRGWRNGLLGGRKPTQNVVPPVALVKRTLDVMPTTSKSLGGKNLSVRDAAMAGDANHVLADETLVQLRRILCDYLFPEEDFSWNAPKNNHLILQTQLCMAFQNKLFSPSCVGLVKKIACRGVSLLLGGATWRVDCRFAHFDPVVLTPGKSDCAAGVC